jgi:UPF0271 protein
MITEAGHSLRQVLQIIKQGVVTTFGEQEIPILAETICIHGDGEHAVEFASIIHQELKNNGIAITHKL